MEQGRPLCLIWIKQCATYLMKSQTAAAPTAVMAIDIARAVAMRLTHSQIVTVAFLSARQAAAKGPARCWTS